MSSTPPPDRKSPELRLLLVVVVVAAAVRLATLGMYPLIDPTEARYAEIGRRMAEFGDWITPWIADGEPFWGKPPFSFWITAGSFKILGIGAFSARLPHWICGGLLAFILWTWAKRRSRREAAYAVALTTGSALFFASTGAVMTDMALALGMTMVMRGFWLAMHESRPGRRREEWMLIIGLAIGLLAKGPLALLLAGLPIAAWAIATGNLGRVFAELRWVRAICWTFALVLPWYVLAEWRTPGFLEYFIVGEHWNRFLVPGWDGDLYGHSHAFPHGTIWLFAVLALMPWTVLVPVALWRSRHLARPAAPDDRSLVTYLLVLGCRALPYIHAERQHPVDLRAPGDTCGRDGCCRLARAVPGRLVERRLLAGGVALTAVVGIALVVAFNAGGWDDQTSTQSLVREYESRRSRRRGARFLSQAPAFGLLLQRRKGRTGHDG